MTTTKAGESVIRGLREALAHAKGEPSGVVAHVPDTVAICLLTADRADCTRATLEAFAPFRPAHGYIFLHADDGSVDFQNMRLAEIHGFETVYRSKKRLGQVETLRALWGDAQRRGADWILHLENDLEFSDLIPERRDAQSIRLYGDIRVRGGGPRSRTGTCIIGTKEPIVWTPDGPGWSRGIAHWGGQPSITRTKLLVRAVAQAKILKHVCLTLARLDTIKPDETIAWHMEGKTTPGFKG